MTPGITMVQQVGWSQFYTLILPYFSQSSCPLRKAIYGQLIILSDADNGSWDGILDLAKKSVPVEWGANSQSLRDSFRRGAGDRKTAAAVYFWLHTTRGLKTYAEEVDRAIFSGNTFVSTHPHLSFQETSDFFDSVQKPEVIPLGAIPVDELERIDDFLSNADARNCRHLIVAHLLSKIERILDSRIARLAGKAGLYSLRNCFTQHEDWITSVDINEHGKSILQSTTNFSASTNKKRFAVDEEGAFWVLVKLNGTRVKSEGLYQVSSWFNEVFQGLSDGSIDTVDLDLLLRYILSFAICKRTEILGFILPDDIEKTEMVIRSALDRAVELGYDMKNFYNLDSKFNQYYQLKSRRA